MATRLPTTMRRLRTEDPPCVSGTGLGIRQGGSELLLAYRGRSGGWKRVGRHARLPATVSEGAMVLEVVERAVEIARGAGAGYADARWVTEQTESLTVK